MQIKGWKRIFIIVVLLGIAFFVWTKVGQSKAPKDLIKEVKPTYGAIQKSITATGNVNVTGIRKVYENWRTPEADQLQAEITLARKTIQAYPMVPALKRIVAHFHHDPEWAAVRPPMTPLSEVQSKALIGDLAKIGFTLGERPREAAE